VLELLGEHVALVHLFQTCGGARTRSKLRPIARGDAGFYDWKNDTLDRTFTWR